MKYSSAYHFQRRREAMNQYAEILRNTAQEIRAQDILGWGNACEFGADEIDRLQAEVERLRSQSSGSVNHGA